MSLLEDVFLEDEAGEAQELERIIEGDEFEERPRSRSPDSNSASENEDEAEEDKRRVDPTKAKPTRVIKNPRFVLNPARLTGLRGIQVLPEHFKDFKFKGKGHEKEDLDLVLKKLEHWAYRLYPKFQFEDCLKKIETLGKKRPVKVHLHKIRTDQFTSEETVIQKDSSDEEPPEPIVDEFDILLQQQIELARATPAPSSVRKGFDTPGADRSLMMPKATSSPSINDEQRERMIRNRKLAEERRLARLKQNSNDNNTSTNDNNTNTNDNNDNTSDNNVNTIANDKNVHDKQDTHNNSVTDDNFENDDNIKAKKHNKSNIIDSSDDENDNSVVNQSVTVDVHDNIREISRHNHNDIHIPNVTDKQTAGDNQTDSMVEGDNHNDIDNLNISDKQTAGDNQTDNLEEADNHNINISDKQTAGDNKTENVKEVHNDTDNNVNVIDNQADKIKETHNFNDNGVTDTQITEDNPNDIDKQKASDIHKDFNENGNKNDDSNCKISENVNEKTSNQQNTENKETYITKLPCNDNKMINIEENHEELMDVDFNNDFD